MKRIILAGILTLFASITFASEELDIYTWLYRGAGNATERLGVLRNVAEAKLDGTGELYAEAISQLLLEQPRMRTSAEKETADAMARLLTNLLGESKYTGAANDLWRMVEAFDNPLVKADALIALGRIRSEAHLELIVRLLEDLNLNPAADREKGEKIAYGAILSLEKYRNLSGYSPVFFAANSWYSRRVKDQAIAALPYIVDDPSDAISSIIKSGTYEIKLLGLQKENESKASASAKSDVALLGLGEAWKSATNDVKERVILSRIRKLSIDMMVKYGSSTPDAVPLLERCYKEGIDAEEKLGAITALSMNKSDAAAQALASFLLNMNSKRRANDIKQEDERMVRAIIPALGTQGSTKGRIALQQVELTDWTNAVKVLATEALKKLR